MYDENDYLMLSGLQHFIFCRRQWALIHIEQVWNENEYTTDGRIFHKNAHDASKIEKRGNVLILRDMYVTSRKYGISGQCDVVEFHKSDENQGVRLQKYPGFWNPCPIEYKRGNHDINAADASQLCAQALCLEEMFCCNISEGYLFFGESHRRKQIDFDDKLRQNVMKKLDEMHSYYKKQYIPKVKKSKKCNKCSLKDICIPGIQYLSVDKYIVKTLKEKDK